MIYKEKQEKGYRNVVGPGQVDGRGGLGGSGVVDEDDFNYFWYGYQICHP